MATTSPPRITSSFNPVSESEDEPPKKVNSGDVIDCSQRLSATTVAEKLRAQLPSQLEYNHKLAVMFASMEIDGDVTDLKTLGEEYLSRFSPRQSSLETMSEDEDDNIGKSKREG